MVTEEIHLNAALERRGLAVIETDLGEYIVQLANDRPSHIIAPIIHLTRQDVGRVMEQRLGVPYSDDAKTLAATARQRLRQEFLRADMGISGANFGVACMWR
jgi:L-lactate dehydrogenase complex protein LldF